MRYLFTGPQEAVFPSILTHAGTLVAQPGDVIEIDAELDSPHLEPLDDAEVADSVVVGWLVGTDPPPEPEPAAKPARAPRQRGRGKRNTVAAPDTTPDPAAAVTDPEE